MPYITPAMQAMKESWDMFKFLYKYFFWYFRKAIIILHEIFCWNCCFLFLCHNISSRALWNATVQFWILQPYRLKLRFWNYCLLAVYPEKTLTSHLNAHNRLLCLPEWSCCEVNAAWVAVCFYAHSPSCTPFRFCFRCTLWAFSKNLCHVNVFVDSII